MIDPTLLAVLADISIGLVALRRGKKHEKDDNLRFELIGDKLGIDLSPVELKAA